jgi:alpha-glucosidase
VPDRIDHPGPAEWWRDAVVYQIYIRSFADAGFDGIGDIAGIRSRLAYLSDLGVDAIWITPWYPSPFADGGYDVADYCNVAPVFGDLDQAEVLIADVHRHGMRIILDLVPNHSSDQHPWFLRAVAAGAGSPEREWYWFRRGRGPGGSSPPNDWRSVFGGPAWGRLAARAEGEEPEWFLHLFAPEQPDLNWSCPAVADAFDDVLRFWFDRGVDGFRIDVANALAKDPDLPDLYGPNGAEPESEPPTGGRATVDHPFWDRDEIHQIFRRWRRVGDAYRSSAQGPRTFVAEAWRVRRDGLARYVRPDELHNAFNFEFLVAPWEPEALRAVIDHHIGMLEQVGASPTWVLSNHDTVRVVTRYGRVSGDRSGGTHVDVGVGRRRARAAALLMLALPGAAYVYQGDELGLPEVDDLPDDARQDPIWRRSGGTIVGRDGCRVPLPWNEAGPGLGFSSVVPWLRQPTDWAALAVTSQEHDASSMLSLYRTAIDLRRRHLTPSVHRLHWRDAGPGVLAFDRGEAFSCVVNLTGDEVRLVPGYEVLVASGPAEGKRVPTDTAVWLTRNHWGIGDKGSANATYPPG